MQQAKPDPAPGRQTVTECSGHARGFGERSALADDGFRYVETGSIALMDARDWEMLDAQRAVYMPAQRPRQALDMLLAQRHCPSFGYQVNNYEHCLQSATMAAEAGEDEETVVVALFHDLGFTVCNETHGEFVAALLAPYVDPRHLWTLERHMHFQARYCPHQSCADPTVADRWRDHEHHDWADRFVRRYDVNAMRADFTNAPVEDFLPMVESVFSRTPRQRPPAP